MRYRAAMPFLPLVCAIVAANLMTLLFCWGMWRARKIMEGDRVDIATLGALLFPLFLVGAGAWLYG